MKKQHVLGIVCILWMIFIFYMSAQVADDSQAMSDEVIYFISSLFHLKLEVSMKIWNTISFIVRKGAHMSEYAVLAILYFLYGKEKNLKKPWLYALLGAILYACTDELHQVFVVGRSGEIRDVCVDAFGACIGLYIFIFIQKMIIRRKKCKIRNEG